MGKHYLWRKNSFEREHPGCVWTIFKMLNYHPWHNVKKMLPYVKPKSHTSSPKSMAITNEQIGFSEWREAEEDELSKHSASVRSSQSKGGSSRKRSIKARIKALLADHQHEEEKSWKVDSIQEHELLALKDKYGDMPTLISLLKENPKLLSAITPVDEPSNHSRTNSVKHKAFRDEYVSVLDLFNVDQDMFVKVMKNSSPPRRPRLVKSGSFPSSRLSQPVEFGKSPSKKEDKYNEAWPVSSPLHELRKAKSQKIARSSSLKDSLERYSNLLDTSRSSKGIKKRLSKSLKLVNEKEFALLSDQYGRKSFRERFYLPENESDTPRASLDNFLQSVSQGEVRGGLRLGSPRDLISPSRTISLTESYVEQKRSRYYVDEVDNIQQGQSTEVRTDDSSEVYDGLNSVSCTEVYSEDHVEQVDWPIIEEIVILSPSQSTAENADNIQGSSDYSVILEKDDMDCQNEELQYVKYVLDIIGFTTVDDQFGAWHSPDQPLDPALFDGIEICCPFELNSSKKDAAIMSNIHRRILFDLINEGLVDIHEKLYAYYPKALSASCHVHHQPKGQNRVVEEVWQFVNQYISWQPELDKELNFAVAHDLSRHKIGWSNLQTDIELLAIDIEEMIFNELLDEIVC